jgi:hypothetical protein
VIPVACLAAGLAFARHPGPVPQAAPAAPLASTERTPEPARAMAGPPPAEAMPAPRAAGSPAPGAVPAPRPGEPAPRPGGPDAGGRTGSVAGQAPEPEP